MADVRRLPGPNTDLWDWQLHGLCRGLDSALFFHPDNERGPSRARREAEAKAICASCPVVDPCRRHALAVREPYGVWGGLSEAERAQLLGTGRGELRTDRTEDEPQADQGELETPGRVIAEIPAADVAPATREVAAAV